MCKGRTHVRVCLSTAELLDAIRVRVQLAEERGHIKRWWEGEQLTTAELLDKIVRGHYAHLERGRIGRRLRNNDRLIEQLLAGNGGPSQHELMEGGYDLVDLGCGGREDGQ